MLVLRTLPWLIALVTGALWIPALARMKVSSFLEVAFFQGGFLLPIFGALLALVALQSKPRGMPIVALVVNALLAVVHAVLVRAPIS